MSVNTRLKGDDNHSISSVISNGLSGLAVATFDARKFEHFEYDFSSKLNGSEMNINGLSVGGTIINIADGTGALDSGAPDWTLAGNIWIESTLAMHIGTNGFDTGLSPDFKTFFDNGAPIDITTMSSLNFWIKTVSRNASSDIRVRWEDSGFNNLGNRVKLSDYITWSLGTWIYVSIPIADFGLNSPVQRLEFSLKNGLQQHYIDGIQLMTAGGLALGPQSYKVRAEQDQELLIRKIRLTLVADQIGWAHNTFAGLPALQSGLLLRVKNTSNFIIDEKMHSVNIIDNMDLFGHFMSEDIITFLASGRLITFYAEFEDPIVLRDDFELEFLVRDDFSQLIRLQARAFGGKRKKGYSRFSDINGEYYNG